MRYWWTKFEAFATLDNGVVTARMTRLRQLQWHFHLHNLDWLPAGLAEEVMGRRRILAAILLGFGRLISVEVRNLRLRLEGRRPAESPPGARPPRGHTVQRALPSSPEDTAFLAGFRSNPPPMLSEVQDNTEPQYTSEPPAVEDADAGETPEATHYFFGESGWQPIQVMEMEMPLELAQSGQACGYYAVVQSGEGFELGPAVPHSYVYEVPPLPPIQPVAAPAEEPGSAADSTRSSPTGTASAWSEQPLSAHGPEGKKEDLKGCSSADERKENRAPARPLVRGKRPEQGRQGSPGPRGKARRGKDQANRGAELEKPAKPRKESAKQNNIFLFAPSKPTFTTVAAASSENWHRPGDKVFAPEPPRSGEQPRFRRPVAPEASARSRRPAGSDVGAQDFSNRPTLDGFFRAESKPSNARPAAEWTADPSRPWTQSSDARPSTQSTADPGRPWTQSTDVGTYRAVSTADTARPTPPDAGGMGVIPPGLDSDSDEEEAARREIEEVEQGFELYPFQQPATGGGARSLRVLQGVRR